MCPIGNHRAFVGVALPARSRPNNKQVAALLAAERLACKLFMKDSIGCLMGVITVDTAYAVPELMPPIRQFIDDWVAALTHLQAEHLTENDARQLAQQTVADFEGAILLSRIYGNGEFFAWVCERVAGYLAD